MPFTVAYADGGINRRDFDAYVRLLERGGIDWSNAPRVPESGTSNRWLYVWADRREAEKFRDELQAETGDEKWDVRDVPAGTKFSPGSLAHVLILMRRHSLGADFSLHPHSKTLIRRRFPSALPVSSMSIEWNPKSNFEREHGRIWNHIAAVLTGLNPEQLATLEGYEVYDLMPERTIYNSQTTAAA